MTRYATSSCASQRDPDGQRAHPQERDHPALPAGGRPEARGFLGGLGGRAHRLADPEQGHRDHHEPGPRRHLDLHRRPENRGIHRLDRLVHLRRSPVRHRGRARTAPGVCSWPAPPTAGPSSTATRPRREAPSRAGSRSTGLLTAIAVGRGADGRLEIYGTDKTGQVLRRSQQKAGDETSWTAWTPFGAQMAHVARPAPTPTGASRSSAMTTRAASGSVRSRPAAA